MLLGSLFIYKHAYSCDEELEGAGHALLIWSGASKDGLVVAKHAIENGPEKQFNCGFLGGSRDILPRSLSAQL
jgi:hypothetical protein